MYIVDTVGFSETAYVVEEGVMVEVCAEVMRPNIPCPFGFLSCSLPETIQQVP